MERSTLPPHAFSFFVALGPSRSYRKLAVHFRVSPSTVARLAAKEKWSERIEAMRKEATAEAEERALNDLDRRIDRYAELLREDQEQAVQELCAMPLNSAMDAIYALVCSVMAERRIRGLPYQPK